MELGRVVVGVDGSGTSRVALRWALAVAERSGAEVVAVHALGLLDEVHDPSVGDEQWRADMRQRVESTWCAPLAAARGRHRVELRDGPAMDIVLALADEVGAGLVVVGSRGVGAEPARALGSTSLRVLEASPVPVLVVPDRDGTAVSDVEVRRMLVGVDPAAPALGALDLAVQLAAAFGAELQALTAVPDDGTDVGPVVAALRDRGVGGDPMVEVGDPATALLEAAERVDADVLVLGTHSEGGPAELLLGSVARTVADRVRRPTLVVPIGRPPGPG